MFKCIQNGALANDVEPSIIKFAINVNNHNQSFVTKVTQSIEYGSYEAIVEEDGNFKLCGCQHNNFAMINDQKGTSKHALSARP